MDDDVRRYADCLEIFVCNWISELEEAFEADAVSQEHQVKRYAQLYQRVQSVLNEMHGVLKEMADRKARIRKREQYPEHKILFYEAESDLLDTFEGFADGDFDPENPEHDVRGSIDPTDPGTDPG